MDIKGVIILAPGVHLPLEFTFYPNLIFAVTQNLNPRMIGELRRAFPG
jgi:hypothetical protein